MGYSFSGKLYQVVIICFAVCFLAAITPSVCPAQSSNAQNTASVSPSNQPPIVVFSDSLLRVNETSQRFTVSLKLLEPVTGNETISVELRFLDALSTATSDDLGNFTSQTINFNRNDSAGTLRNVSVSFSDDAVYEGNKAAIFQLQNVSGAQIGTPQRLEVSIIDNDAPKIVINEIYAGVPGQSGNLNNAEQKKDLSQIDFVELVNTEPVDVDLSGWVLSSDNGLRYQLPSNTIIEAGRALVLFGTEPPSGHYGGAQLLTAEGLNLSGEGDRLVLNDLRRNPIDEVTFDQGTGGRQSMSRAADGQAGLFMHSQLPKSGGQRFSPGKLSDGTSFGSRHATAFRDGEGWYLISSPTGETTFKNLLNGIWTQGSSGSNAPSREPNIYTWNEQEGGEFIPVTDLNRQPEPGQGYLVYLFEDDAQQVPGIQGGFPKHIQTDGSEPAGRITVPLTAVDLNENSVIDGLEGWNLIGNPFGTEISVDALLAIFEALDPKVNANIMVWDPSSGSGNGAFLPLKSGETVAPFQAFWIRYTNADGVDGSVALAKRDLLKSERDSYQSPENNSYRIKLRLGDGNLFDEYLLEFNSSGTTALDRFDAFKLNSLNQDAINLYGTSGTNKLTKNVLPMELENNLELPVAFDAPNRASLNLQWNSIDRFPDHWEVSLIDRQLNREIDMRTTQTYRFDISGGNVVQNRAKPANNPLQLRKSEPVEAASEPRFLLSIKPASLQQNEVSDIPESVKLNPNYPNPFNPTTTISYELKEDAEVILSIWNIVGQRVTTLVDGMVEAGEHTATWNASDMPSGLYIAQLEVGGQVFIRKMTLIK